MTITTQDICIEITMDDSEYHDAYEVKCPGDYVTGDALFYQASSKGVWLDEYVRIPNPEEYIGRNNFGQDRLFGAKDILLWNTERLLPGPG